jgi:broad specificity phosphatase PhoE
VLSSHNLCSILNRPSAGTTNSALTNHGVLQANRLAHHLVATDVKVTHIFSSDLTRAFKTAEAIRLAQPKSADEHAPFALETKQLANLREQDFGSLEGKTFYERSSDSKKTGKELNSDAHKNNADFKDVETQEAMRARSNMFIDEYLLDLFHSVPGDYAVVVVAHGIILAHLWRCVLHRFAPTAVSVAPDVLAADREFILEHLGGWSNTGYLELEIMPRTGESLKTTSPAPTEAPASVLLVEAEATANDATKRKLLDLSLVVKAVNSLEHLKGLKRTRGGIGSSKYDEGQKTIESSFKKRKIG